MKATITYKVASVLHPWNDNLRAQGVEAWCLVKVTRPAHGQVTEEVVAMFNLDSEAHTFQGHVFDEGLDGRLLEIHPSVRRLFEADLKFEAEKRG